jgi:DUF1365 family protein
MTSRASLDLRSALYVGTVMHARGGDAANHFRYRHAFLSIDLDELPLLERRLRPFGLPLLGTSRRGLVRIDERDWMRTDPTSACLRDDVVAWARARDEQVDDAAQVELVTTPRQLGRSFNPISIFYVTPSTSTVPTTAVVEVHSTFGENHRYMAPVGDERSSHDKSLHVSPFLPMGARYEMRLPVPDDRFLVRIDLHGAGVPFVATWTGRRRALTPRSVAWMLLRFPLGPHLVLARIHLQAFRLWVLRRAPLYRKPPFEPGTGTIVSHDHDNERAEP